MNVYYSDFVMHFTNSTTRVYRKRYSWCHKKSSNSSWRNTNTYSTRCTHYITKFKPYSSNQCNYHFRLFIIFLVLLVLIHNASIRQFGNFIADTKTAKANSYYCISFQHQSTQFRKHFGGIDRQAISFTRNKNRLISE